MRIIHTYQTQNPQDRIPKQADLYRRCILLLAQLRGGD